MMLLKVIFGLFVLATVVRAYFTMTVFAPQHPEIDAKVINARDKAFIIGADSPTTYCGLHDPSKCPDGNSTLINGEMTLLASSVPGGQFIFVAPDGSVSYPSAHSSLRPPGAQMGGFYSAQIASDCDAPMIILSWQSEDGAVGLWACPTAPGIRFARGAILKATTSRFSGVGCVAMEGIRIHDAGDDFGAWAYS